LAYEYVLKGHNDGEAICDYLQSDTYLGRLIIPSKYREKYQEKVRAEKYEYYLTRGLPIPPEYMPKEERERNQRRKLASTVKAGDEALKTVRPFQPQIAMNMSSTRAKFEEKDTLKRLFVFLRNT
jgi:hypothetical protein